jgi:hypothetical protein
MKSFRPAFRLAPGYRNRLGYLGWRPRSSRADQQRVICADRAPGARLASCAIGAAARSGAYGAGQLAQFTLTSPNDFR